MKTTTAPSLQGNSYQQRVHTSNAVALAPLILQETLLASGVVAFVGALLYACIRDESAIFMNMTGRLLGM